MADSFDSISTTDQLTATQDVLISLLSIPSVMLSMFGSSVILSQVWKRSKRKNTAGTLSSSSLSPSSSVLTPYQRLLVGLSSCDILFSITLACQVFLLPQDTSFRTLARGNDATCSALGFVTQFNFSSMWYNGMLSFYFLGTIRFGIKTDVFAKRIEPVMHIAAIGWNLIAAIAGLVMGWYREMKIGQFCWITRWPEGCEETDTCQSTLIAYIVGALPAIVFFLGVLINNFMIYCHVRKTLYKSKDRTLSDTTQQDKRIQTVATQAFLYVGSFYMTFIWTFILKVLDAQDVESESQVFPLLVLQSIFMPMQGFFNLLIYVRPEYLKYRKHYPDAPSFRILKHVIHLGTGSNGDDLDGEFSTLSANRVGAGAVGKSLRLSSLGGSTASATQNTRSNSRRLLLLGLEAESASANDTTSATFSLPRSSSQAFMVVSPGPQQQDGSGVGIGGGEGSSTPPSSRRRRSLQSKMNNNEEEEETKEQISSALFFDRDEGSNAVENIPRRPPYGDASMTLIVRDETTTTPPDGQSICTPPPSVADDDTSLLASSTPPRTTILNQVTGECEAAPFHDVS